MATIGSAQATETCFGLAATITAPPGQREVRGTEGDDVIVAKDVSRVLALGGDDAICVTGPARIEAGDGNDRVQSHSGRGTTNVVILGSGSDLFEGSEADDEVYAEQTYVDDETLQSYPGTGTENTDSVRTYGGDDVIVSGARLDTQPDNDEVQAGPGDDLVSLVPWLGGDIKASGGAGTDWFQLRQTPKDSVAVSIDLAAGTAMADGVQFSTAEEFENVDTIHRSQAEGSALDLRGNDAANTIVAWGWVDTVSIDTGAGDDNVIHALGTKISAQAGPGDDRLTLYGDPQSVVGGPGRDTIAMQGGGGADMPVVYDLRHGLFWRGDVAVPFETERLTVLTSGAASGHVQVLGTSGRDVVTAGQCGTVVRGAGGDDLLRSTSEKCEGVATTLYGNGGDDVLRGGSGRDVLLGGTGSDRAFGGASRDRCRAELKRDCERN